MDGPLRTCVGCRRLRPKRDLIRLARSPDGTVRVDPSGTAPGRGAYVCGVACLRAARGRLGRALRAAAIDPVSVAQQVERASSEREG